MGSKSLSQYDTLGSGVSIDLSWDESPTITVVATANTGHTWRIRGKNPDTTVYLTDSSGATGVERTFDAPDDIRDFAFQVYYPVEETYSSGKLFTVEFSDDESDSGDSGGGSGGDSEDDSDTPTTLHIGVFDEEGNVVDGATITVTRTWSNMADYGGNVFLSDGDTIYYPNDRFTITAEAKPGYELTYFDFEDKQLPFYLINFESSGSTGDKFKLTSAALNQDGAGVATIVRAISTVHIHDGTDFASYQCHIYNGSDWDVYTPYIHNGTDWYRYS